jgi:hypothetical protein
MIFSLVSKFLLQNKEIVGKFGNLERIFFKKIPIYFKLGLAFLYLVFQPSLS